MQVAELVLKLIQCDPTWHVIVREDHIAVVPVEIIEETDDGAFVAIDMDKAMVLCLHDDED
jgi:hypothetical protein